MKKLPCPRCGKLKHLSVRQMNRMLNPHKWEAGWEVRCGNCCMSSGIAQTKEEAIEVWNTLPRHLCWTTKRPIEPGWYWYRLNEKDNNSIVYVDVYGTVITYYPNLCPDGWSRQNLKNIHGQWSGPMPEPKDRSQCYDDRQRTD